MQRRGSEPLRFAPSIQAGAMQFTAIDRRGRDAGAEARRVLARLPATVHAFILVELQKWPLLFGPEQRYQRALLEHFSRLPGPELDQAAAGIARIEAEAGANRLSDRNPGTIPGRGAGAAATSADWLSPGVRRSTGSSRHRPGAGGTALSRRCAPPPGRPALWQRHRSPAREAVEPVQGRRRACAAEPGGRQRNRTRFSRRCLARASMAAPRRRCLATASRVGCRSTPGSSNRTRRFTPCATRQAGGTSAGPLTGLSYDRLRTYRDDLTRALNSKIQSGVESPQAFAAYARSLQIAPPPARCSTPPMSCWHSCATCCSRGTARSS